MPASDADLANPDPETLTALPFPPVTKSYILNCSIHSWYQIYRSLTPKSRLIPLSPAFIAYLHADGIVLPDDDSPPDQESDLDNHDSTFSDDEQSEEPHDPSADWRDIHTTIASTITELGGKVVPKLNWSAPKDATWINASNSMDCRTPNDIYLLLKSSDFITHDLEHAFDGCNDSDLAVPIPYHLALRKHVNINPSLEFRCFVRKRVLLGMCQRDLNHYDFLFNMQNTLCDRIREFFEEKLRDTFPDPNFVFDVYIPAPHRRVWLIDINPWAPRTDPLLWSWLELLTMPEPSSAPVFAATEASFVRLSLTSSDHSPLAERGEEPQDSDSEDEEVEAEYFQPELRLIGKDDPEAFNFNTPQYSAHKLPRDVVDASQGSAGSLREFADQWRDALERRQREDEEAESESGDEMEAERLP